jgi:hypothetical protein
MRIGRSVLPALLALSAGVDVRAASASNDCYPTSGLELLCGQTRPEDAVRIPGTRWLIVSGFSAGAGLKLLDTREKDFRPAYTAAPAQSGRPDARFPDCSSPPDPLLFNAQGISLRRAVGESGYVLYVVNHGGRESVEVFHVDARGDIPRLSWRGCVLLPQSLAANSVAAYSDGTVLITVLTHSGDTYADFVEGRNTGGVYERRPGSSGFQLVPGTQLPGNNGIETARDDSGFFVVAFGRRAVLRYSRRDATAPPMEAIAPGFMPDNIHWDGDRLITAGMVHDEPACGGTRNVIDGKADDMRCRRGTVIAELDPRSMAFRTLAYTTPDSRFNGASAAVVVDDLIWIASYQTDCVARLALPGDAR